VAKVGGPRRGIFASVAEFGENGAGQFYVRVENMQWAD